MAAQNLRIEHDGTRLREYIIDLFAVASPLESIERADLYGIGMQHPKSVNHRNRIGGFCFIFRTKACFSFQISCDRVVLTHVEITGHYKGVRVFPVVDAFRQ